MKKRRWGTGVVLLRISMISLDFIGYLAGLSSMRLDRYVLANVIGIFLNQKHIG